MLDVLMAAHWIESDAGTDGSLVLVAAAALVVVAARVVVVGCVAGATVARVVGTSVGAGTVAGVDGTTPGEVVAIVTDVRVVLLVLAALLGSELFGNDSSVDPVCRLVDVGPVVTVGETVEVDAIGAIGLVTVVV